MIESKSLSDRQVIPLAIESHHDSRLTAEYVATCLGAVGAFVLGLEEADLEAFVYVARTDPAFSDRRYLADLCVDLIALRSAYAEVSHL